MINERNLELVHAGLDGELGDSDRAELDKALQDSSELRELQAGLLEFSGLLDDEAPIEPPADLHGKIMHQISLPAVSVNKFRFRDIPGFVRYGLAAAAGLVLTVGIYESQLGTTDSQDISSMVGTIMNKSASDTVTLDAFAFDFDEISSVVSLQQRDGALVLDVVLDSRNLVVITVDFTSDGLQFDAIAQMQSDLKSIEFANQAIHIEGTGRQHFAVLLHRDGNLAADREATITLRFTSNGKLIKEGSLVTR